MADAEYLRAEHAYGTMRAEPQSRDGTAHEG